MFGFKNKSNNQSKSENGNLKYPVVEYEQFSEFYSSQKKEFQSTVLGQILDFSNDEYTVEMRYGITQLFDILLVHTIKKLEPKSKKMGLELFKFITTILSGEGIVPLTPAEYQKYIDFAVDVYDDLVNQYASGVSELDMDTAESRIFKSIDELNEHELKIISGPLVLTGLKTDIIRPHASDYLMKHRQ